MDALLTTAKALGGFSGRDGGAIDPMLVVALAVTVVAVLALARLLPAWRGTAPPRSPRRRQAKPAHATSKLT